MNKLVTIGNTRVGTVNIDSITFRRQNYRKMTREQWKSLQSSIDKFGFKGFILVEEEADGKFGIVDGHHRYEALKSRGIKDIPIMVLDANDRTAADLAMLSFNVSGEIVPEAYFDFIKELQDVVDSAELAALTANREDFLAQMEGLLNSTDTTDIAPTDVKTTDKPKKTKQSRVLKLENEDTGIYELYVVPNDYVISPALRDRCNELGIEITEHIAKPIEFCSIVQSL